MLCCPCLHCRSVDPKPSETIFITEPVPVIPLTPMPTYAEIQGAVGGVKESDRSDGYEPLRAPCNIYHELSDAPPVPPAAAAADTAPVLPPPVKPLPPPVKPRPKLRLINPNDTGDYLHVSAEV